MEHAVALFGSFDENIKLIEKEYNVRVIGRDSELKIDGEAENVSKACKVIESLLTFINRGEALSEQNVRYCISLVNDAFEVGFWEIIQKIHLDRGDGGGVPAAACHRRRRGSGRRVRRPQSGAVPRFWSGKLRPAPFRACSRNPP